MEAAVEAAVEARLVGGKMEMVLECPICNQSVYSGTGNGCKMCGMLTIEDFCCKLCMRKHSTITKMKWKEVRR